VLSDRSPAVRLRPASGGDEEVLRAVDAGTQVPGLPAGLVDLQYRARRTARAALDPPVRRDVVLCDGQPVGELVVQETARELRLLDFALLPAVRDRGIGTRVLAGVQERAGNRTVRLSVRAGSPARRLYERAGFRPAGGDGVHEDMQWTRAAEAATGEEDS
jgi:ribosomal protein S18 acetylase RimI-like enzyme